MLIYQQQQQQQIVDTQQVTKDLTHEVGNPFKVELNPKHQTQWSRVHSLEKVELCGYLVVSSCAHVHLNIFCLDFLVLGPVFMFRVSIITCRDGL